MFLSPHMFTHKHNQQSAFKSMFLNFYQPYQDIFHGVHAVRTVIILFLAQIATDVRDMFLFVTNLTFYRFHLHTNKVDGHPKHFWKMLFSYCFKWPNWLVCAVKNLFVKKLLMDSGQGLYYTTVTLEMDRFMCLCNNLLLKKMFLVQLSLDACTVSVQIYDVSSLSTVKTGSRWLFAHRRVLWVCLCVRLTVWSCSTQWALLQLLANVRSALGCAGCPAVVRG